ALTEQRDSHAAVGPAPLQRQLGGTGAFGAEGRIGHSQRRAGGNGLVEFADRWETGGLARGERDAPALAGSPGKAGLGRDRGALLLRLGDQQRRGQREI